MARDAAEARLAALERRIAEEQRREERLIAAIGDPALCGTDLQRAMRDALAQVARERTQLSATTQAEREALLAAARAARSADRFAARYAVHETERQERKVLEELGGARFVPTASRKPDGA